MRKYIALNVILLLAAMVTYGQNMLRVEHLNVEDGLSQSSVYSIYQDSYGFIWMATGDGLNRYDGREFIAYKSRLKSDARGQIKDRNINSELFEDAQRNMWFTADEGVYCMDRRTSEFSILISKHEASFAASVTGIDKGVVWVCVTGRGVYSIDVRTKSKRLYPFADVYQTVKNESPVILDAVNTEHGIWIADLKGLMFFDKAKLRDKRVLLREHIAKVYCLKSGVLLLCTKNGLIVYDPVTGHERFITITVPGWDEVYWRRIVHDDVTGSYYLASETGGAICKLNLVTGAYELMQFQRNTITRMYIDRSQNLWVGTDGAGVYRVDIKQAKFYCYAPNKKEGPGFMVKSVYRDETGVIWMGVYGTGILRYDPRTRKEELVYKPDKLLGMHPGQILRDSAGYIMAGLDDRVVWLDATTGKLKREVKLPIYPSMGSTQPVVYSLAEWRKGHFLVGTNHCLYSVVDEGGKLSARMHKKIATDSFISGWVYNIFKADSGIIYVGKRNGYAKIRMVNDSTAQVLDSWHNTVPVRHFYRGADMSYLWIATEQGLVAYNERTKRRWVFDERAGINNSYIYGILPENDSVLWVSTNKGLTRVCAHFRHDDSVYIRARNYTSKDGLQSNEFNTGAFFKAADGMMLFGGIAGVNWFDPGKIQANPYVARPAITGVYVDDTLMVRDTTMNLKRLELPFKKNTISITYRALEFTLPEGNQYAYMLEGQDRDWVYTSNDKVRFANLAPGTYTFKLKVSNNEGLWNDEPLELELVIVPPYWQTWWFRALIFLALAGVVAGAVRMDVNRRVRRKTLELEKQHALNMERLRISKDVHDDIGSGLSRISLLSEMAARKIKDNQMPEKDLGNISTITKELVDNMRDLIWVLNPENTTLENLITRIREYCADYLDGLPADTQFSFPDTVPALNISREVQRNIFSTVKEAVNNCVKHSGATRILIAARVDREQFILIISDNGKGFDECEARKEGNGLRNMKHRISVTGGIFEIVSGKGSGTQITISVPFVLLGTDPDPEIL